MLLYVKLWDVMLCYDMMRHDMLQDIMYGMQVMFMLILCRDIS